MHRKSLFLITFFAACGVDSTSYVEDGIVVDETDAISSELTSKNLSLVTQDIDVEMGRLTAGTTRLLTDAAAARAFLGPTLPSGLSFSRHWLLAYRPSQKKPASRIVITRAQLSSSGQTLTVWATETENLPGCLPWLPNELAVVRLPKQSRAPTRINVQWNAQSVSCGITAGPACTSPSFSCPTATPFCHGRIEQPDGTLTDGQCVKFEAYTGTSGPCRKDADCGQLGYCSLLSLETEGLCQPLYSRGTFSTNALSSVIPRAGTFSQIPLTVSRLLSVPMDAWVSVFVKASSSDYRHLRLRVVNPAGTVSQEVSILPMGQRAVLRVPGDESINGVWKIEIRDTRTSGAANVELRGLRLSYTSRWD